MTFLVHWLRLSAVYHELSIYATEMCRCCLKSEKNNGFSSFVNFLGQSANPFGKQIGTKLQWYKATKNWYKLVLV